MVFSLDSPLTADSVCDSDHCFFFGYLGVSCALVFASIKINKYFFKINWDIGAAYGTAKSGVGISSMGVLKPELIMKSIIPVVMAGILGIYGMIVAVILAQKSFENNIIKIFLN